MGRWAKVDIIDLDDRGGQEGERRVPARVSGFTPLFDSIIDDLGPTAAMVFGKAWRYCQMRDGVCKARQGRLADELGLSRETVNRKMGLLCREGYLRDLTPDATGVPHVYADTGKVRLEISVTGG